ncbi:MAG: MopE-related protein [Myxococcota bacterium]
MQPIHNALRAPTSLRWPIVATCAGLWCGLALAGCGVSSNCGPSDRYVDGDGDGFGAGERVSACTEGTAYAPDADDCDDTDPETSPEAPEVCDDIDNDCNGIVDEGVPPRTWYADADEDGFGDGETATRACEAPDASWVSAGGDCDDADATVNPRQTDVCDDGIDQDCDGVDRSCAKRATCLQLLQDSPGTPSGAYPLDTGDELLDVYCDMDTDGGGWTLVASTIDGPFIDAGTRFYNDDLQTLFPEGRHLNVWSGLRASVEATHDLRIACKPDVDDTEMTVDLSFYDVPWYHVITEGGDRDSCFAGIDGAGALSPPPARRNNRTGEVLPLGDPWERGYLEAEPECDDLFYFKLDFDAGGQGLVSDDQTDWGEDFVTTYCGTAIDDDGAAWFVLVR